MNELIEEFIQCRSIAVVGFSRTGKKFGNSAYKELKERGFEVYAIHPTEREIGGVPCFPNLSSLFGKIDGVFVCVPPQKAIPVLEETASLGIRHVWLQQGSESPAVYDAARRLGLPVISKKCILMYVQPVRSFHRVHRIVNTVFGRV